MRSCGIRRVVWGFVLLALFIAPRGSFAQAQLFNAHVVIAGHLNSCAATGAVNTYACSLERTLTAYETRACYSFTANAANTGVATINFNSLGARTIKKVPGGITTDLVANDIRTGQVVQVCYDGTNMQMISQPGTGAGALPVVEPLTASSASISPLGAHAVIACDATGGARTYTLPTGATATLGQRYRLIKVDSSANACSFQAPGSEQLNGVASGTKATTRQYEDIEALLITLSPVNWHVTMGVVAVTHSLFIAAAEMDVSGACALNATAVLLTNGPKRRTITCTDADADSIEFDFVMPDGWDGGTLTVELALFNVGTNASTLVFEMDFAGQCVQSGVAVAAHSTTGERATTFSLTTTDNVEYHATTATPITLNGSCAAGAHVYMRGQVDATATTMTPIADVKLLGVKIEYVRTATD